MEKFAVGIDEVGRGPLAGPFVVGAVSFLGADPEEIRRGLEAVLRRAVADSKKLTAPQRERAAEHLKRVVAWSVGAAEAGEVDGLGLSAAAKLASGRALDGLRERGHEVGAILADAGLRHPYEKEIPTQHIVKGDEKVLEIACASIIAKVHRDALMKEYASAHPEYGWEKNAGYGSAAHLAAIRQHGITPLHRRSFLTKMSPA